MNIFEIIEMSAARDHVLTTVYLSFTGVIPAAMFEFFDFLSLKMRTPDEGK